MSYTSRLQGDCPACGHPIRAIHDWVRACASCGLELSSLDPGVGGDVDGLEALRKRNFAEIWMRLQAFGDVRGKRLLEVGCARGWFLESARDHGVETIGIEPGNYGAEAAEKGFTVLGGNFPDATASFEDGSFDFVVFNDVFEHLSDPTGALRECARLLGREGRLVINLPMSTGVMYRMAKLMRTLGWSLPYERLWQKAHVSPHQFYYSKRSLGGMVKRTTGYSCCGHWPLRTVVLTGLWPRIRQSFDSSLKAAFVYAGCVVVAFAEKVLPPDIGLFVFEWRSPDG